MGKLEFSDGGYKVRKKIPFVDNAIRKEFIITAFEFAYDMAYGDGFHRDHRSGGSIIRTPSEVLVNTFQGKLAELVLNDELKRNGIETEGVDLGVYEEGVWDHGDIIAGGKKINVKSMAFFSNLFLLEYKDWDENGIYIPDGGSFMYDYFIAIRIKPNIKELQMGDTKQKMLETLDAQDFYFDIPGVLSLATLKEIIKRRYIIRKGEKLNKTTMDADNYYIQCGDLKPISMLYSRLKDK